MCHLWYMSKTKQQIKQDNTPAPIQKIKMGPALRRIYRLEKKELLQHYALIVNKASSLSSAQRRAVNERVSYGFHISKSITEEEINAAFQELADFVTNKVVEGINQEVKNDSSTEE